VARRLIASLSEDGWLILGASDPAIAEMIECDVVLTDAGLVYRRPGAAGPAAAPYQRRGLRAADAAEEQTASQAAAEAWAAGLLADAQAGMPAPQADLPTDAASAWADEVEPEAAPDVNALIREAYDRRDFDAVSALARAAPAAQLTEPSWLAWLRSLANQGCLEEAGEVAARAVDARGATAELLYLHAVLQLQGGHAAAAADTLRRALYLDRGLVVAHLTLADAHRRRADPAAARRALRNAAALLQELPEDALVPAADGETAGRLAELVRVKLRLLDEAA
jgi:chemotaxis protein methyltransferase CheR